MSLFVRRLTAPGRGAVAVIQVTADDSGATALDRHFQSISGRQVSSVRPGRICYGHWGAEDVVVVRTNQKTWEIQCHGGEAAVQKIADDLGGMTTVDPTKSLQTLLSRQLLKCRTVKTARYLLSQQQVLPAALRNLRKETDRSKLRSRAAALLHWQPFAEHLTTPWKVAVVGCPNAGKSSLVNVLAGYERAIVYDQPGTTRDRLEVDVVLNGYPMQLIDTAGIRQQAGDQIEREGIRLAVQSMQQAHLCLHIVDAVEGWRDANDVIQKQMGDVPTIVVGNKCDLVAPGGFRIRPDLARTLQTSAVTLTGLSELIEAMTAALIPEEPALSQPLPVLAEVSPFLQAVVDAGGQAAVQALHAWIDGYVK